MMSAIGGWDDPPDPGMEGMEPDGTMDPPPAGETSAVGESMQMFDECGNLIGGGGTRNNNNNNIRDRVQVVAIAQNTTAENNTRDEVA